MILNYATPEGYANVRDASLQLYETLLSKLQSDYLPEFQLVSDNWHLMVSISDNNERVTVCYTEHNLNSEFAEERCAVDTGLKENGSSKRVEFTRTNGEVYTVAFYGTLPRDVGLKIAMSVFSHGTIPDWVTWKPLRGL